MGLCAVTWSATGVAKASRSRYSRAEEVKARVINAVAPTTAGQLTRNRASEGAVLSDLALGVYEPDPANWVSLPVPVR